MKKWSVSGTVVGGMYLGEYQAETGEEAIQMALEKRSPSFCHQCNRCCEDAEIAGAVAEHGDEVVEQDNTGWESKALAAGWTPPKAKRAKARD